MACGIYKIKNLITEVEYIGLSSNTDIRWRVHKQQLRDLKHENQYLQNAWNKHGKENFLFEIIEECDESQLKEKEIYWGKYYKENGIMLYNIADFGNIPPSPLGKICSAEHKKNVSKSKKGKPRADMMGDLNPMRNPETRKRFQGEKHPYSKLTLEQVNKIRDLYKTGDYSQQLLSKMFNVNQTNISHILTNKTWKE